MRLPLLLALLLPAALSSVARADCLLCSCSATTVSMDFGVYVATSVLPTDGVGAVRVRCSLIGTGALPVLVS